MSVKLVRDLLVIEVCIYLKRAERACIVIGFLNKGESTSSILKIFNRESSALWLSFSYTLDLLLEHCLVLLGQASRVPVQA